MKVGRNFQMFPIDSTIYNVDTNKNEIVKATDEFLMIIKELVFEYIHPSLQKKNTGRYTKE